MPLTKIDADAALVVIDLQKGIVAIPAAHPMQEIVARTARLARAFRERKLPVVLVHVTGRAPGRTDAGTPSVSLPPDWSQLVPELERQPEDCVIGKQRFGAFLGTSLDEYLRSRGVTQVFSSRSFYQRGVESTARSAYDLGYSVVFVSDAMTDRDGDTHRFCMEKIFPRLGEIDTAENVLKALR